MSLELKKAYRSLLSVVDQNGREPFIREENPLHYALTSLLRYLRVEMPSIPRGLPDAEVLPYVCRKTGVMKRQVELSGAWYGNLATPLLAEVQGRQTFILPSLSGGCKYFDYESGVFVRVNRKNAARIERAAVSLYRPCGEIGNLRSFLLFCAQMLEHRDLSPTLLATLLAALAGLAMPFVNMQVFDVIIPAGTKSDILPYVLLASGALGAGLLFAMVKAVLFANMAIRIGHRFQGALWAKLLALPPRFFRQYQSGDLTLRVTEFGDAAQIFSAGAMSALVSGVFALVYLFQAAWLAPPLLGPTALILVFLLALMLVNLLAVMRWQQAYTEKEARLNGLLFELYNGIAKLKLAAAELRAFSLWAGAYGETAKIKYAPPWFVRYAGPLYRLALFAATIFIFGYTAQSGLSSSAYISFSVAYGALITAFLNLEHVFAAYGTARVSYTMIRPLLTAQPEAEPDKVAPDIHLAGGISVSNLRFSYSEDMPPVLDGVDLDIAPGEYVAIVGGSGSGKSTLLRLLLGFEQPLSGAIYYDDKDLQDLDIRLLRRQIGVVLQDGKLQSGDIYANIAIACPGLTLDEAWQAAEQAALKEDIERLPMDMFTQLAEGGGGLSGGQKQKLMTARALANKPRILFLDEATSALDNLNQAAVAESLARLNCTRVVIAHRLSTVMRCDRVIVLDKGKIAQQGTPAELLEQDGLFKTLAARQI